MSIVRKGIILSAFSYLTLLVGVAQTMILSRALGPEGVGQLSLLRQLFLLGAQLASLGLPMAMIGAINKKHISPSNALRTGLLFCGICSVVTIFIIATILMSGFNFLPKSNVIVLLSMTIWVPTVILRAVYYNVNTALLQVKEMSYISFFPQVISLICFLFFWINGKITVEVAVMIEAITAGAFSLVIAIYVSNFPSDTVVDKKFIDWSFVRSNLYFGLQFLATDMLVLLNGYILLLMLSYLTHDYASIGYFSRGLSLATLVVVAVQSLQRFTYSHWSLFDGLERAKKVENTINTVVILIVFASIFVMVFAKPIVIFLYGYDFINAVPVTRIVIIGIAINFISQMLQSLYSSSGKSKYNLAILFTGLIVNLICGYIFIPIFKDIGCAYSLLISSSVMTIVSIYIACKKYDIVWQNLFIFSPSMLHKTIKTIRGNIT